MKYFTHQFITFFQNLEKNNTKEWFDTNRTDYENNVREPFKLFTRDLVKQIQEIYPGINLQDKFSIGRINRDIRFGADKTPYKTQMSVMVLPHGKGEKSKPGFYLQMNHKDIKVYSGAHMLEKNQLEAVRLHIMKNMDRFNTLISQKEFKTIYGYILGDKHKRLSKEFQEVATVQPLIANKNFYWYFKLKPELITKDQLIAELIANYKVALPLNSFFEEVLL